MKLSRELFYLFEMERKNGCADDDSVYVELLVGDEFKYFKLQPVEVSLNEYNEAWDRASNDEGKE